MSPDNIVSLFAKRDQARVLDQMERVSAQLSYILDAELNDNPDIPPQYVIGTVLGILWKNSAALGIDLDAVYERIKHSVEQRT